MPVHLRLNDKDTSRNPFINYVTALPGSRHDEALRRLQQLAAQVKPLMQAEGFHINSLEEFEWNREFAGRNWNNGEVIELVLTSQRGEWLPLQYVLYVFCHELAHIKHMNHIPSLHGALTRQLKEMALEKQRQGYFGDGMWSAGRAVGSGGFVSGLGMHQGRESLPEHVCGGALNRRQRGSSGKRRRRRGTTVNGSKKFKGPSLHTGAQTAANTRGGNRRVTLNVGTSAGSRVDGQNWIPTANAKSQSYKGDENSTFRKRTQSKDAREKRANAALARFQLAQSDFKPLIKSEADQIKTEVKGEPSAQDSETEDSDVTGDEDSVTDNSEDEDVTGNDLPDVGNMFTQGSRETSDQRKRRMQRFQQRQQVQVKAEEEEDSEWKELLGEELKQDQEQGQDLKSPIPPLAVKKESSSDDEIVFLSHQPPRSRLFHSKIPAEKAIATPPESRPLKSWTCLVCTLVNEQDQSRCAACDTGKGGTRLGQ